MHANIFVGDLSDCFHYILKFPLYIAILSLELSLPVANFPMLFSLYSFTLHYFCINRLKLFRVLGPGGRSAATFREMAPVIFSMLEG